MNAWKRMQARQRSGRDAVRLRAEARGVRPLTAKEAGRRVTISIGWWIIGILGLFLGVLLYRLLSWVGLSGRYIALACIVIGWILPTALHISLLRRRRR